MMKRSVIFSALALALASLCAYADEGSASSGDEYRKVADHLYEVVCNDYDCDYLLQDARGNSNTIAYCSAIREGQYLGRNLDFVAGDAAEIVVRSPGAKDRYASVGMVGGLMWLNEAFMESGLDDDSRKLIPILLTDGINEKGLAVEINCVNAVDVGGPTLSSNTGNAKKLSQLCVVRYLLDRAATTDEAIELLKNVDIVVARDVSGLTAHQYEFHFLIADKNKTCVVEFDNRKPDGEKMIVLEDETIMTNFYLHICDPQKGIFSAAALGVERYRKLFDNRRSGATLDGMKELMRSVRYSNSNRLDGEYAPGENFSNPYVCYSDHLDFDARDLCYANYKERMPEILRRMKRDDKATADILKDPQLKNPNALWITSHSVVYDLENKSLSVAILERFDRYYDYSVK